MTSVAVDGAADASDQRARPAGTADASHDLWVFGYGSLMWHPGFAHAETVRASLTGWHRCFCIWSVVYRGTPRHPGLVLGLDRGGVCEGMAFRVLADDANGVLRYLRWREQVTGVYREALLPVTLARPGRPEVMALTYLAEPSHPGYAGDLPLALQAGLIRDGRGRSGDDIDYFASTLRHLARLSIRERRLERLAVLISTLRVNRSGSVTPPTRLPTRSRQPLPLAAQHRFDRLRPSERRRFLHRRVVVAWPAPA